jgi:hypothetical protein
MTRPLTTPALLAVATLPVMGGAAAALLAFLSTPSMISRTCQHSRSGRFNSPNALGQKFLRPVVECRYYAFPWIVEMKIWRLLCASRKAEKLIAMASSYVSLTISIPEL